LIQWWGFPRCGRFYVGYGRPIWRDKRISPQRHRGHREIYELTSLLSPLSRGYVGATRCGRPVFPQSGERERKKGGEERSYSNPNEEENDVR
jgi:hypothetical protein